jgi:hypothetical protein
MDPTYIFLAIAFFMAVPVGVGVWLLLRKGSQPKPPTPPGP